MIKGGSQMNKCDCYNEQTKIIGWLGPDEVIRKAVCVCNGTKEQDVCSCGGDRAKCDFYLEVRNKALKEKEPMKAKLLINGKELEVEISEEELKKLEEKQKKKTGYERVDLSCKFFWDLCYKVADETDTHIGIDNALYDSANYYSSKEVAENNARADRLMRQLRRFAVEHRTLPMLWGKSCTIDYAYYIFYDYENEKLEWIDVLYNFRDFGKIYFDSMEAVDLAIETFRDELLWYFTEYEDSL
jgi:hypothetical protein